MKKFRLLITARSFGSCGEEVFRKIENYNIDYTHMKRDQIFMEDDLMDIIQEFDGIIVGADIISKKLMDKAENLKIIAKHGVGLDNIDLARAKEKNIVVTIADQSNNIAVAEHGIAMIFSLAKNIVIHSQNVKSGKWVRKIGREVTGQTLGVLGTGTIGKEVIKRLSCFGMNILAFDTLRDETMINQYHITYTDIDTLLTNSDYVSLHLPLTFETKKIISRERMSLMKETAFIINTARGGLIDEDALFEALQNRKIAGAGIDTFENEPPKNSKLLDLDNVIASPHTGAYTYQAIRKMSNYALDSIIDYIEQRDIRNKI